MKPTEQGHWCMGLFQAVYKRLVTRKQSPGWAAASTIILTPRLIAGRQAAGKEMQLNVTNSAERFDNTRFSNEVIVGVSLPLSGTYACPRCHEMIGFTKEASEKRSTLDFSNLSLEIQSLFGSWAEKNDMKGHHFLDWNCPKCHLPARVYVQHWIGGRHGDAGVDLLSVLELAE
jgi:hypothetical protein